MNRWNEAVERFLDNTGWKGAMLMKICACAVGVLIGLAMPWRKKWSMAWFASLLFAAAYVPLMEKFLPLLLGDKIPIEEIYHGNGCKSE